MEQMFVEVLNRSIAAGWVILVVAVLRLPIRKAPKWTACLLWALVAARLVCPFSLESAFSLIPSRETVHGGADEPGETAAGDSRYAAGNGNGTKQGTVLNAQGGGDGDGSGGTGEDKGAGASAAGDPVESEADSALRETFVREWAEAFVSRDGNAIQRLASEGVAEDFELEGMLSGPQDQRSFGFSSPWPEDVQRDVRIHEIHPEDAVIYYYAWTSEPHVTVWKERIFYRRQDGGYLVTREELTWLDDISAMEDYIEAYGYFGIDGTAMDYEANGAGEQLNSMAMLSSDTAYQDLLWPERAARRLLNLPEDVSGVTLERIYEEPGSINFHIRFPGESDDPMPITMMQPYGPEGIWIPKNRRVDVVARFKRIDWEEIRGRHMVLVNEPGLWNHVVLIAELPEDGIRLYGYNDIEWSCEGVAVEIGDDVNYFDWIYTSTRMILPECYWNREKRQLQVALNIYTGTGIAAQALHVLQYDDHNVLWDRELNLDEMLEMLYERIGFSIVKETGQLRLFDKENRAELGLVDIGKEGTEDIALELGMISHYSLGESIRLSVEPGYFPEGASIAEYPEDMPTLEVEVRLQESGGRIQFMELGEVRSDFGSAEMTSIEE